MNQFIERRRPDWLRLEALLEANPMLGHRGCRLGITFPEIYDMQVRAIMEAACEVAGEGHRVEPEIMIPLTGTVAEMKLTREMTDRVARQVISETGKSVRYSVGTMVMLIQLVTMAKQPVSGMSYLVDISQRAIAGSKSYFDVMEEPEESEEDADEEPEDEYDEDEDEDEPDDEDLEEEEPLHRRRKAS